MKTKNSKQKDNKNIIFVSIFIGTMLVYMLTTAIYVSNQVANCSSVKKLHNAC